MLKSVVQVVVFVLEILMLIVFGWYGYSQPVHIFLRLALAAGLVIAAIILWSIFAAPNSRKRLPLPALAIFRAAMFLVAAFFVYHLGHRNFALIIAAIAIITQVISCYTEK